MAQQHEIAVEIANVPILLRTPNAGFRDRLASHYAGFLGDASNPNIEFDVDIISAPDEISRESPDSEDDVQVSVKNGEWCFRRNDFVAQWDPRIGRGRVRQPNNLYSTDAVLRIVHTLILARQGGFLLHAASGIRNGRAKFLTFAVTAKGT